MGAFASHIVGAELFYTYQGNNKYLITLRLYRNGNCGTCAAYSAIEYVQVFDASGNYVDSVPMAEPPLDTIPQVLLPCQTSFPDILNQSAVYTGIDSLPPRTGGYTLVYQRCCRNAAIQSIYNNTGATYVAHVSNDVFPTNSSPRFTQLPPIFVCADQGIRIDYSATDLDGDSLSYSLTSPLDGASSTCPDPSPNSAGTGCPTQASPPPYTPVVFYAPYSYTNPTNNPVVSTLTIDPVTGLLTGIPNQTGIYIVAVAVSEFRNGVYIDQTIRDYQFNIVECNNPSVTLPYAPGTYVPSANFGVYAFDCNSDTVRFNPSNIYNPPPSNIPLVLHWDFGVPGLTNDTANIDSPVYVYPDTGTYVVTFVVSKSLTDSTACNDTVKGIVVVYPVMNAHYSFINTCQDSSEIFTDQSVSTSSPIYSWQWNFGDGDTSEMPSPLHHYDSAGAYAVSLTVVNRKGCVSTLTDMVHVKPQPVTSFTDSSLCVFDNTQYTYTGTGIIAGYYWDLGGVATSTIPDPSIVYTTPGTKQVSLITVTPDGCRDTMTRSVVINPLPTVTISPSVIICPFTTTQLTAGGGVDYVWSPGSTLSDSVISDPVATPTVPTTYHVTVTDVNGCRNTNSVFINLYPVPQINAGPDTSVCMTGANYHTSVQLTATGGVTYVWTPATALSNTHIANPISSPTANQTYYVTGTDTDGCSMTDSITVFDLDPSLNLIVDTAPSICDFDTINLNVLRQGDSYYNWTPNVGISNASANNPDFFPHSTTTYVFTVENYCYNKMDTVTIIVHPLPPLATEGIDSVCIGDTTQLHATGAGAYIWRPDPTLSDTTIADPLASPSVTDIYYVTGIDTVYGCRKKDSVLVYVYLPPVPGIGPDTPFICQGRPVQLIATGGVDYQWTANSTLSPLNVANPIAITTDTMWYYVRVYNVHQCHADDSIKINVQLPVHAVAQLSYDVCVGLIVHLSSSGGFYYQWTPAQWLSDADISNPISTPDSTIVYQVKVSNDCFSDIANVTVTVRPLPVVEAGNDTTIFRNTPAMLDGRSNVDSTYWYPGNNIENIYSPSTAADPLYTTIYYLYATSEYGCTNLDSVKITVEPYTLLLLPNAFSPNDDGLNDVFRIVKYLNIEKLEEFAVYDDWGQKVFSTDNINDGWDGTYKGQKQQLGVYVWYVKALTYDNQEVLKKGNVTLMR